MPLISKDHIQTHNAALQRHADTDYEYLGEQLARRYIDIDTITQQVAAFGVGSGHTPFVRHRERTNPVPACAR